MYSTIYTTHKIVVVLFLLIYLIKTALLLSNSIEKLAKFSKVFKIPEMIVSFLFLITGGYMLTELPEINKLMVFKLIAVFASIPLAVIGFKKSNKVLASFSLLLIIGAYGLAEMSKKRGTKTTASDHLSNNGKDIYTANCMKCHGEDGSLGLAGAIDLSTSTLDNTTAKEVVRIGRGAMMGYGNQLSNEQITKVVDYIETLRK